MSLVAHFFPSDSFQFIIFSLPSFELDWNKKQRDKKKHYYGSCSIAVLMLLFLYIFFLTVFWEILKDRINIVLWKGKVLLSLPSKEFSENSKFIINVIFKSWHTVSLLIGVTFTIGKTYLNLLWLSEISEFG